MPAADAHHEFGELLSDAEIKRITDRDRPTAQLRALKRLGLPARMEHGVVLASRFHLREWLGGSSVPDAQPNWSAVS